MNKHQHLDIVEAKIDIMTHQVKLFMDIFYPLFKKGFHFFWEEKSSMLSQKEYYNHLIEYRSDHRKFADMHQSLLGKAIVDKLADDFEMLFCFRATCARLPYFSYRDHVEIRVLANEIFGLDLPFVDQWKLVEKYGTSKHKLHE